jgi:hypothetical protein
MSRRSPLRSSVAVAVACTLALLLQAPTARAQDGDRGISPEQASAWSFEVVPFLWLPEVEGSVGTRGITADVDVDFNDLFDLMGDGELFAGGGHFEARYDRFSFFVDAFGGTARPTSDVTFGPRRMLTGTADLTLDFTFVEFGPAFRVLEWPCCDGGRPIVVDLLTGGRFMYFYQSISLRGSGGRFARDARATSTWVDPFAGGRFAVPLVGELDLVFRGDIGGFGAGSALAWNLIGGFEYHLPWQPWGARTSVVAVYKALDFDYESGSRDAIDIALDLRGPALGLAFEF